MLARNLKFGALALAMALTAGAALPAAAGDDPWHDIRRDVFDNRDVAEDDGTVSLEAPYRAEDAAIVPLTVRIPAAAGEVKSLTLVIDKNPAPVAATFHFGEAAGKGDRMLSTRVRIDMYSNVRAVVETADGRLHMATKFVKASGGCSAAASKDADEALASLGKMQIRTFDAAEAKDKTPPVREAQVMIRHPNFTGMQMDQVTRQYTPMRIVSEMDVTRDGARVFKMEGGISISENPNFRFSFVPGGENVIEVTAKDTEGQVFTATSAKKAS
ncbi:MAG: quinoprotein dehydrogenase-associated SoxYZ-like carrier [Hyphomicrobium sp.]|jgi:sulfur-oxidizing protein SoxY